MKEILISNDNVKIVQLPLCTILKFEKELKSKLRLQKILILDKFYKGKLIDISGIFAFSFPEATKYESLWVLEKTDSKNPSQVYTQEEEKIILSWLIKICDTNLRLAESLCQALKDEKIASWFYHSYGEKSLKELKINYQRILEDSSYIKTPWTGNFTRLYTSNRYTILEFLNDLVRSKARINLYREATGKDYKRISRKIEDGSTPKYEEWYKVVGISGNRTRANINLRCLGKISVIIPENEVGVEPGEVELKAIKSINIVVDGILNTKSLGIKVSDKKFIKKLKLSGVLIPDGFLYTDEFLVDLTKMPICKVSGRSISSFSLAQSELSVYSKKVLSGYIEKLIYLKKKGLISYPKELPSEDEDPKEEFLHSIGIYGDMYYGKRHVSTATYSYVTEEIIGVIDGLPKDPTAQIVRFINKGSSSNSYINNLLSSYYLIMKSKSLDELEKSYEECQENLEEAISRLRDFKFRLIMGKTLRFSDKYKPQVEKTKVELLGTTISWKVKKNTVII